ncbi:zinc ribbon-containing protein [Shewanella gelidii]|uniref:DUF1451 domain-containing protein n=1 Tax=Shewanella gelidii TaxID=1642821 RepID=A0A917JKW0_9GAMM|nr:zinc ribbon-containing protein [Shewanella gelidii]MCL1097063.1 zinc ribbon-containing protein [Shewanella gelidii]GGI72285.1 DUF1451 domain-containing protein [Shewanella gelidii]
MSERSSKLLALYDVLLDQVKLLYKNDKSLTQKDLFDSVTSGKDYLLVKADSQADELALVEQFLKRDIASFLQQQNEYVLSHSPMLMAVENTLWHWLGEITDKSQVEWHELAQDFKHHGYYESGEIVNQGTMVCTGCGHETNIEFPSVILDCTECEGKEFTREQLQP